MSFKPQLFPVHRSPRGGWVIQQMIASAPDAVRKAWVQRKQRNNKNGHQAVEEMAMFLSFQKLAVSKDVLKQIQDRADLEWCMAEPSRCPRTASASGGRLVREAAQKDVEVVLKAVRQTRGGGVVRTGRRGCCGG